MVLLAVPGVCVCVRVRACRMRCCVQAVTCCPMLVPCIAVLALQSRREGTPRAAGRSGSFPCGAQQRRTGLLPHLPSASGWHLVQQQQWQRGRWRGSRRGGRPVLARAAGAGPSHPATPTHPSGLDGRGELWSTRLPSFSACRVAAVADNLKPCCRRPGAPASLERLHSAWPTVVNSVPCMALPME